MRIHHEIHNPLLSRLNELAQQRPFYDRPRLWWVTGNYLERDYLSSLAEIAPAYGVKGVVLDDSAHGFFDWSADLRENPAVGNWLADLATRGLCGGILVDGTEEKKRLEQDTVSTWSVPIEVFSREATVPLDGVGERFGGGRLAYLAMDRLTFPSIPGGQARSSRPCRPDNSTDDTIILVRIDRPGAWGPSLGSWGNVFGISLCLLAGVRDANEIEEQYARLCFGDLGPQVHQALALSRTAVDKSFLVQNSAALMDRGCFPRNLQWLDGQMEAHPSLNAPTRKTLDLIDLEKIEALEAAHDAWKLLDGLRGRLDPRSFLWLEHYFQHLKVICLVLRTLADVYFCLRAAQMGSAGFPGHAMESKFKALYGHVRENRALLGEFEARSPAAGGQSIGGLLQELGDKITDFNC